MKPLSFSLAFLFAVIGCAKQPAPKASALKAAAWTAPVQGPFTDRELRQFAALDPIDTHTHVYRGTPEFYALLKRLNLHILDITLDDDTIPAFKDFPKEKKEAWAVVDDGDGYVAFCSSFDPYKFAQPGFAQRAIRNINRDFARGAVAVKFYKNVGMEIKDAKGRYIMPDDPVFEPIFKDIAAHRKTLITHLADPDSVWEKPNPAAPDYEYLMEDPQHRFMYGKPGAPSKQAILHARDVILDRNPDLRMVGAHLGSMEGNFDQLGRHLDKYPNFAVDMAARMPFFEMQPREKMIAFITRYQNRLIYGTDSLFYPSTGETVQGWENNYARDWRYLATNDTIAYSKKRVQGLDLPPSILRKLYHDNAVKWFPGVLEKAH